MVIGVYYSTANYQLATLQPPITNWRHLCKMKENNTFLSKILANQADKSDKPTLMYRGYLPHWQPLQAIFFVTFRLKNSIPITVLNQLRAQRQALLATADDDKEEIYKANKRFFKLMDDFLDTNPNEPYWLKEQNVMDIVKEALHYRDGKQFVLYAYCIMPNHVHLLIQTLESNKDYLYKIIQDFKKRTGKLCNKDIDNTGNAFWEEEYYDHLVRNETEFYNIVNYIYNNPVKAKFVENGDDWAGTYIGAV